MRKTSKSAEYQEKSEKRPQDKLTQLPSRTPTPRGHGGRLHHAEINAATAMSEGGEFGKLGAEERGAGEEEEKDEAVQDECAKPLATEDGEKVDPILDSNRREGKGSGYRRLLVNIILAVSVLLNVVLIVILVVLASRECAQGGIQGNAAVQFNSTVATETPVTPRSTSGIGPLTSNRTTPPVITSTVPTTAGGP
ncbi:uncharacterized protein LOC106167865 isoform X1 [Lingula anatina]|uniref:Uncharacterized protein LOC106167865 isoform X1 n=1 Tax=Lingula anatina TaxID=7574 RepID=A0A1S3IW64_LINAN|nr:uncharacterized protein LOC106167865 isoform X1 [Lingula anatina]|eukprot:XP_013402206.1 uncharacterized protein LOC106167865 isoform X1 [Lingula anatina]